MERRKKTDDERWLIDETNRLRGSLTHRHRMEVMGEILDRGLATKATLQVFAEGEWKSGFAAGVNDAMEDD